MYYSILNETSGAHLGIYEADSPQGAIHAMVGAGALEAVGDGDHDLIVTEIPPLPASEDLEALGECLEAAGYFYHVVDLPPSIELKRGPGQTVKVFWDEQEGNPGWAVRVYEGRIETSCYPADSILDIQEALS